MAFSVKERQNVERRICRALIKEAIKAGYYISVDNGEEIVLKHSQDYAKILSEMFSVDEERLRFAVRGEGDSFIRQGWVFLMYGESGWDVITDYTVNLEHIMTQANILADAIEEKYA